MITIIYTYMCQIFQTISPYIVQVALEWEILGLLSTSATTLIYPELLEGRTGETKGLNNTT